VRTPVAIGVVGDRGMAAEFIDALEHLPHAEVLWVCSERGRRVPALRRGIRQTARFGDVLDDERVDAVVVAAPAATRAQLAASSLDADKHVYVAGVPAQTVGEAEHLVCTARRRGRCLLSGDSSRFDPLTAKLLDLIRAGELGDVFYVHSERRVNGGHGESLLWSAAPDELAFVLRLLGDEPISVSADGESFLDAATCDLLDLRLAFATGIVARLTLTALDARAGSTVAVVGSHATAVIDRAPGSASVLALHSDGDPGVVWPRVPRADPLHRSCEAFLAAVRAPGGAVQDVEATTIVDVVEQAQRALLRAAPVKLTPARQGGELRVVGVSRAGAS